MELAGRKKDRRLKCYTSEFRSTLPLGPLKIGTILESGLLKPAVGLKEAVRKCNLIFELCAVKPNVGRERGVRKIRGSWKNKSCEFRCPIEVMSGKINKSQLLPQCFVKPGLDKLLTDLCHFCGPIVPLSKAVLMAK